MSKNITALILIVLAVGIYFTFTSAKVTELKSLQAVNAQYQTAIDNSALLLKQRDAAQKAYNNITPDDQARLNKLLPDNVDNVRLIIDVKDDIAARHNLTLKAIKTASPTDTSTPTVNRGANPSSVPVAGSEYGIVTLSFTVTTSYQTFIDFMKDLESSLRIMDISHLTVTANDTGLYDFNVEIHTYWLKQ